MLRSVLLLSLWASLLGSFAPVVRRHDRPDEDYKKLALDYPQTCHVGLDGVGVLIAPRWILTAAHVAEDMTFFRPTVRFLHADPQQGQLARVDRVVLHPGYVMSPREIDHDFALLRLAEPVEGIEPTPILREGVEEGLLVTLVGDGDLGTGETGAQRNDGQWRAATNLPTEVREHSLLFRFEKPGEEGCTELEGFWGPGDSGTPAFVEHEGTRYVAGIGSHGQSGTEGKPASYGSLDVSYRVSYYAPWIDEMLKEHAESPATLGEPSDFDPDAIAAKPFGECVLAYFETLKMEDDELRSYFVETFATDQANQRDPELIWRTRRLRGHGPRLEPIRYASSEDGLDVLARSEGSDQAFVFRLRFEGDEPRLAGVRVVPVLLR